MQIEVSNRHRESREIDARPALPVHVARASELGAITLPDREKFLELGRNFGVAPLAHRLPEDTDAKLRREYAHPWIMQKATSCVAVMSACGALVCGEKAIENFAISDTGSAGISSAAAVFLGYGVYRLFRISSLYRGLREAIINDASRPGSAC